MPFYTIQVEEIRHYTVLYTVEADSPEEAKNYAQIGDTVEEEELENNGVIDRHIHEEPELTDYTPKDEQENDEIIAFTRCLVCKSELIKGVCPNCHP